MHKEEITDILEIMQQSVLLVLDRFDKIEKPDDFSLTPEGVTVLDAISMRLQVIGEAVKRIQKMDAAYLDFYSGVEWNKIAKFRDFVSHHYENVDHEIVYDICQVHIPKLRSILDRMLTDIR